MKFLKPIFLLILISMLLLYLCSNFKNLKKDYLIIGLYPASLYYQNDTKTHLPPPPLGYTSFNLVIDSQYSVYFHYHKLYPMPCFSNEEENNKVRIEFIQTDNIICLNQINLGAFYEKNKELCMKSRNNIYIARIALMKDSIPFDKIKEIKSLIFRKDSVHFIICEATDEEKVVIFHKKNKLKYYPEDYPWDTSRNIFVKRESEY